MGESPWKPGRVLAGRYRLERQLGEGGMGAIWRAEHLVLAAPVAVKLIDPEIARDADMSSRFMREAQAAAALRSPHVVQIIDYGMDGLVPFMVMELLEGETLAQRIQRVGRLSAGETVRVFTQVARAVQRAHEAGIVHRDLKPENVFLVHNQDEDVAKVLDFGVAKMNLSHLGPSGARTKTGSLLGTPFYMSPEQAQGNKAVDHRSDLWSLGVIAFEMLTGQRPFYSEGLGDLVLQICVRDIPMPSRIAPLPHGVDGWFARATARDPDLRFQSAREMSDSLRESLGVEGRETLATGPESGDFGRRSRDVPAAPQPSHTPPIVAETRPGLGADPAHAQTVLLAGANKPSLTVRQFSTTSGDFAEPPKSSNATAWVIAVAASALVLGLGAGVLILRQRIVNDPNRPLPTLEQNGPTRPGIVPEPPPEVRERPVRPEPPARAPEVVPSDAGAAKSAPPRVEDESKGRAAEPSAKPAPRANALEAGVAVPSTAADAGWVKPDWARPDDEPPAKAGEPEQNPISADE